MGDQLNVLVIVLAVLLVAVGLWVRARQRPRTPPPAATAPEPPKEAEPEAPPASPAPPSVEPLAAALRRLGGALEPRADASAHPREMVDWPEFAAVVEVFRRPDVSLGTLRQYACGANWPLSCAAFAALAQHPERGALTSGILSQLGSLRPWTLFFALN